MEIKKFTPELEKLTKEQGGFNRCLEFLVAQAKDAKTKAALEKLAVLFPVILAGLDDSGNQIKPLDWPVQDGGNTDGDGDTDNDFNNGLPPDPTHPDE